MRWALRCWPTAGGNALDNILTVAQLNEYVKELFDGDPLLRSLAVCGELSNYKIYPSGHHYFSL